MLSQPLGSWRKTQSNNELSVDDVGKNVTLMGWVNKRRDHGGVIFIDLRDCYGITQVVFSKDEKTPEEVQNKAEELKNEFVVAIQGTVVRRAKGMDNPNLATGSIEVTVTELRILNSSETLPFQIDEHNIAGEETRLKYRYLDLRRPTLQKNFFFRSNLTKEIRNFLDKDRFIEIETPYLSGSTPEGSRDYVVPSRVHPGMFFALTQSPQLFKQLLMSSGFERYYQVVRCFRDEDLRADRQPEFTQLDIEMSFVDQEDIMSEMEQLMAHLFKTCLNKELTLPIPRMSYDEAIEKYGVDRPDTRFSLEMNNITHLLEDVEFKVFKDVVDNGGLIKAINAKRAFNFSRKDIEKLTSFVQNLGAKGLAYIKIGAENSFISPITKFLGEKATNEIVQEMNGEVGDIIFFGAGEHNIVNLYMSKLRLELGEHLNLIDKKKKNLLWIVDFPMFEYDSQSQRYIAMHHPFTSPQDEYIGKLSENPSNAKAKAYDMVMNGIELGGGSIRNSSYEAQLEVFKLIGMSDEEAREKFGFLLDALKYGYPPEGGLAFGLDRIVAMFLGTDNIREVIAFPKTQKATDLLCNAPSKIDTKQMEELHLKSTFHKSE